MINLHGLCAFLGSFNAHKNKKTIDDHPMFEHVGLTDIGKRKMKPRIRFCSSYVLAPPRSARSDIDISTTNHIEDWIAANGGPRRSPFY